MGNCGRVGKYSAGAMLHHGRTEKEVRPYFFRVCIT